MPLAVKRAALFSQVTIFQGKKMIEADRLIAPENPAFRDEDVIDRAIRPKKLADYQVRTMSVTKWRSSLKLLSYVAKHLITF